MIQRWLAVVGVCMIMGDADICTAICETAVRGVLCRETEYLDQVTADLREASGHGDIIMVVWAAFVQMIRLYLCLLH